MVRAVLHDGTVRTLAAKHGDSIPDVIRSLTANTLTGSAAPLDATTIEFDDGTTASYASVVELVDAETF